ncbi:hypothetical protein DNTS_010297, partial [Danionella cerebrum]
RDRAVADSEQQGVVLLSNTHAALDDERRRPCAKAVCWGPEIIRKHRCASGNTVVARRMRSFQDVSPCSGATRRQSYFTRIRICVESSEMFEDLMNVSSGLRALCCERMLFVHQLQTRISARGSHAPVVLSRGAPGSTSPEMSSDMRLSDVTEQLAQTQELVSQLKDLIREKDAALCARDDQQKELTEQIQRLQNERESFQSKLEAERHIARARLKDLMEKQEADLRRVKLKEAEASKAESKFLKMKAWSKSRIRQLEEELRRAQTGRCLEDSPDVSSLHRRVAELQEEREDLLGRLEMHEEVKARNEELQKQLLEFKEQQRKMQADLEQVTQRASQGSEAPMEDVQLMEWQEMVTMVTEAEESQDEKNVFRMSHMEEEREALANRQQEVEEELAQVRGLGARRNRKQEYLAPRSLQEEFAHTQDVTGPSDPDALLTGENMGGWWPQHSAGDTDGLRSVVEELELERNQLQEQIQVLEKQCQDLEERLQLQARVELLQNESERLRSQLASLRSQQLKDSEKHQLVISKLNKELKGLSSTQECLESSLLEKEHSLARTSEKLEHIESLREAVADREKQNQEQAERLLQAEHSLAEMKKTCSSLERENSELKAAAADQTLKLNSMKDKAQKQESSIEALQCDLQQTNEDLERLNAAHLEERAQLLHDLQSCEREIDRLQDILTDKDKEILALASSMAECSEQIQELKQEVKLKEEVLANAERSVQICSDPELSGALIPKLIEQLKKTEGDLKREQVQAESRRAEVKDLMKRMEEAQKTIQDLQTEAQSRPAAEQALGKEERNMLLAEVSKQKAELLVLTKQLEEQVTSHRDAKEKSSKIASLEQKVKNLQEELDVDRERFTSEVRTRDEAKDILEKHLSGKLESIKSLEMDKQKLEETVEQLLDELGRLKHHLEKATLEIEDLREQQTKLQRLSSENSDMKLELEALSGVSEENSSLQSKLSEAHRELSRCSKATEDLQKDLNQLSLREEELRRSKQSLEETVVEKEALGDGLLRHNRELGETLDRKQQEVLYLSQAVSEWETKMLASLREKEHLASQVTSFDEQRSDLQRALNETTREREALLQTQDAEIRKFEEEARVLREQLLEKASECDLLTKALRETNEELDGLRQALESSGAEVLWFQKIALEKDQVLSEQHTQMEASRKLLEERMATLEKQAHAHGTGLTEKMVLLQEASEACGVLRREVNHERELVCSLQEEKSSLKEELSRLHLALEAKEKALAERTLECQKRSESLVSLTGQLGLMSTNTARLESSNASLSDALAQRSAEDTRAKEELARMQLELVEHRDRGQALMEQNVVLKSELKNSVAEVLRQQEKITSLQNQLESRSLEKVSLEQRLRSEMDSLRQTLQEKEEMLRTQEMCVQLLESKGQIISELQEEIQRLRITLQDKDQEITLVMAQLEAREARLRAEVEASAKLQEELKSAVEQLDGSMLEKDSPVMQEKEKVEHIQSRTSELELMVPQLNCRIEQMKRLVDTQAEKLQLLSASQSQIQTLEERNKSLQEERDRTQQELLITSHERALKEQEIHKLTLEREEVLRSTSSQIQRVQDLVQQLTWPSGTRTEARRELVKEERPHVTETIALQRSDGSSEPWVQLWSRLQQLHLEMQRRDSAVLQLSASMEKAAEEKRGLCSQLSSVSRMLKDSQQTAGELQNRCYWLERQLQSQYSPAQASVPPGAPQEPVGSSFSPDGSDGRDLRNRLSEAELQLSQLSSRLEEERSRREAAEEALHQRRAAGVECKQAWHPQEEFSVQLENTDEEQFEELIIRPKQRLFLSKMNGGLLLCRRLLAGRSAPSCSRLLRARLKPRYLFLSYVLLLHLLLLICLGSALHTTPASEEPGGDAAVGPAPLLLEMLKRICWN